MCAPHSVTPHLGDLWAAGQTQCSVVSDGFLWIVCPALIESTSFEGRNQARPTCSPSHGMQHLGAQLEGTREFTWNGQKQKRFRVRVRYRWWKQWVMGIRGSLSCSFSQPFINILWALMPDQTPQLVMGIWWWTNHRSCLQGLLPDGHRGLAGKAQVTVAIAGGCLSSIHSYHIPSKPYYTFFWRPGICIGMMIFPGLEMGPPCFG